MARIVVTRTLPHDHETVWEGLAALETHVEWMRDAVSMRFDTNQRRGVGTIMEVETRVGPLRTLDRMEVTGWVEGESVSVAHTGLITGEGTLSAHQEGEGTTVVWDETLRFPWWLGGPVTARLAGPILARIWRANLAGFEESLSSP